MGVPHCLKAGSSSEETVHRSDGPGWQSAVEIGHAVPDELDGDGENQKAENLVDGANRGGSQPPHQWASEPKNSSTENAIPAMPMTMLR